MEEARTGNKNLFWKAAEREQTILESQLCFLKNLPEELENAE